MSEVNRNRNGLQTPKGLSSREVLPESIASGLIRGGAFLVCLTVASFLIWSTVAPVEETARGQGKVIPVGDVQMVQSLEGGVLQEIKVEEGQLVQAGEAIASFDTATLQADIAQAKARHATLALQGERYTAFIEGRDANFAQYADTHPILAAEQTQALDGDRQLLQAELDVIDQRIEKTIAQRKAIENELPAVQRQLNAAREAEKMFKDLTAQGLSSRLRLLETQEQSASFVRQRTSMKGQMAVLDQELIQLQQERAQLGRQRQAEALEARAQVISEMIEVESRIQSLQVRIARNDLVSPVDGVIQSVVQTKDGAVIEPGGVVAEIVPYGEGLLVEARVSPKDIGFIAPDQTARVKVDAFDFSRFGMLEGQVEHISPSTFTDEEGGSYYKALIKLEKSWFGEQTGDYQLVPGMTTQVDITTGEKTLFEYLLKPVYAMAHGAFRER